MSIAVYLPCGCLTIFTRDPTIPLCAVRVFHPAQHDLFDNHPGDRQKKTKKNGTLVV